MRREEHHYTKEQVREHLLAALTVVDELEIPDDLRSAAFTKAVELLSGKQILFEQVPAARVVVPDLKGTSH